MNGMLCKMCSFAVTFPVKHFHGCLKAEKRGNREHFAEVFKETGADAALAASIFHYGELTVGQVKESLAKAGVPVRLV